MENNPFLIMVPETLSFTFSLQIKAPGYSLTEFLTGRRFHARFGVKRLLVGE